MNKILDRSKLHTEIRTNKNGVPVKKLIRNEENQVSDTSKNVRKESDKKANVFFEKLKKLQLNAFPPNNINEKDIKIHVNLDNIEECNQKCVASWKAPNGKIVRAYTKTFLDRNALVKWKRIEKLKKGNVDTINKKATELFKDETQPEKLRQAGAIISIIVNTGLRIGQTSGLKETGNKGVSTISPDDVDLNEDDKIITINFRGKSYKQNNSIIKNEPELFSYLKELKKGKQGSDRLFDIDRAFTDAVFKNKLGNKTLKLKDLRTYVACDLAREVLFKDFDVIKNKLSDSISSKDKKIINDKLKLVYEEVANKLNNSPTMVKNSYIHPAIRVEWLNKLGIDPSVLEKGENSEIPSLDDIIKESIYTKYVNKVREPIIDEDDEEDCDIYNLFSWENEKNDNLKKGLGQGTGKFKKVVTVHKKNGKEYLSTRWAGSNKKYTDKHFDHLEKTMGHKLEAYQHWLTNIYPANFYDKGKDIYFDEKGKEYAPYNLDIAYRNKLMKEKYKGKLNELHTKHTELRKKFLDSKFEAHPEEKEKDIRRYTKGRSINTPEKLEKHPFEEEIKTAHQRPKTADEAHALAQTEKGKEIVKQEEFNEKNKEHINYNKKEKEIKEFFDKIDFENSSLYDLYSSLELNRKKSRVIENNGSTANYLIKPETKLKIKTLSGKEEERTYQQLIDFLKENKIDKTKKLKIASIIPKLEKNPYKIITAD